MNTIAFRGGETTGGVADRTIETSKKETTGGIGARRNQDSIFTVDNELQQDTVSFRASQPEEENRSSILRPVLTTAAVITFLGGALGLAHKYDAVGKLFKNKEKTLKFFRHMDTVTKPCYDACAWVKKNCYNKVVDFIKGK